MNVTMAGESEMSAHFNAALSVSSSMSAEGSAEADFVRIIVQSSDMSAESSMNADIVRIIIQSADMSAEGSMEAALTQFRKEMIDVIADFNPGDIIVIDTKRKTVTINGQNASHLAEGFMKFLTGTNEITYVDSEGSRTVDIKIQHREKYLY
jgi:hypothetical protein